MINYDDDDNISDYFILNSRLGFRDVALQRPATVASILDCSKKKARHSGATETSLKAVLESPRLRYLKTTAKRPRFDSTAVNTITQ